jgi:hypothetical protein
MSKFKVGDKVKRVKDVDKFIKHGGSILCDVLMIDGHGSIKLGGVGHWWEQCMFELAEDWSIYNNTLPLSELSDEQRGLLFNHWCNGGGIVDCRDMGVCPCWDPDNVYRAKQKSERELFIEAAIDAMQLHKDDLAKHDIGKMYDAGFKAPKVGKNV